MKIKIRYTFKEIGGGIAGSLKALFLDGLIVLAYSLLMLVANLAIRACEWLVKAVRNFPCVAAGVVSATRRGFPTHCNNKAKAL